MEEKLKYIVRIASTDLEGDKPISHTLTRIKGINFSMANAICHVNKLDKNKKTGSLKEQEIKKTATQRANDRANTAKWSLEIAIFLFAVVIIIIILSFQGIGLEIVAPVAVFGLSMVWLCGWRQGKQSYERFYNEELSKLQYERMKMPEGTVEEIVQKALRERLQ